MLLQKKPARSHKHLDAHFKDVYTWLHGKACDAGFTMSFSRDVETQYRSTWWGSRHTEALFLTNVGEGTVPQFQIGVGLIEQFSRLFLTSQTVVCTRRSRTSLSPETQAFFWLQVSLQIKALNASWLGGAWLCRLNRLTAFSFVLSTVFSRIIYITLGFLAYLVYMWALVKWYLSLLAHYIPWLIANIHKRCASLITASYCSLNGLTTRVTLNVRLCCPLLLYLFIDRASNPVYSHAV